MIVPARVRIVRSNPKALIEQAFTARLPQILEVVKEKTLAKARSHVSRMNPPARKGGPWRPAHPEPLNWSDVTGQLAASYFGAVERTATGWRLLIGNSAEHAIYVEARDGYAVVTGIVEAWVLPFLQETIAEVAPGWEVRIAS